MKTRHTVPLVVLHALALGLLPSCTITRLTNQSAKRENPPDLAQIIEKDHPPHFYQIKDFQIRHVWGGEKGYVDAYRAVITVKDGKGTGFAELYFKDAHQKMPENPDPNVTKDIPYQIYFPMSTLDAVLHNLRLASQPVYLFHYGHQWAVGVLGDEAQPGYKCP